MDAYSWCRHGFSRFRGLLPYFLCTNVSGLYFGVITVGFLTDESQIPPFRRDPLNNKPDNIKKGLHGEMSSDQYIDVTHRTTKRNAVTNGERKRNSDLNVVLQKALAVVD